MREEYEKTVTLGFIRSLDMSLCYSTEKYQYYLDEETGKFYKIKNAYVCGLDKEFEEEEKMYQYLLSLKNSSSKI